MCFEAVVRALPAMRHDGEDVRLQVERLSIEPYDLEGGTPYDLILDRITHWYFPSRERLKKAVLMDGVYVLNNPWSLQSMEKQTTYCAMMRLGLPVPGTWMVPQKEYAESDDLQPMLERYARHFDLGEVGRQVGFPLFMKPYDGGAWKGVTRIEDEQSLRDAYEQSGRMLMHLQRSVEGFDHFARCIGVGPQVRFVDYDPGAALHDRYACRESTLGAADRKLLEDMTLTINAFFGWDFNSCEGLRSGDSWYPIDFANACPDGQVTSLHYHFPWLVSSLVKWSVFCAVTRRPIRMCMDWEPFFKLADETQGAPLPERLAVYGDLARQRLSADEFAQFCQTQLSHADEIIDDIFGGELAHDAVRQKVAALFPEHEVEQFTELFWSRIQDWRSHERACTPESDA
ncbi:MAG: hypothetical protein DRQ55_06590 [Planctomycetota bacterium]|nr:MAG: hypothetical protein DRQ55_06590 [Planctomycetota bacterium]